MGEHPWDRTHLACTRFHDTVCTQDACAPRRPLPMDQPRIFKGVSMNLRLTTADENFRRVDWPTAPGTSPVVGDVLGRAQVPPLQLDELEPLNRLRSHSAPRPCRGATRGRPSSLSDRSEGRGIFTRDTKTQSAWRKSR